MDSRSTPARNRAHGPRGRRVRGLGVGLCLTVATALAGCTAPPPSSPPPPSPTHAGAGAAADSHDPWDVAAVERRGPVAGPAFEQALFTRYVDLARIEQNEGDWRDNRLFLDQARRLLRREPTPPTPLEARLLSSEWRAILAPARARLIAARDGGGRSLAPQALAEAQSAFECWMQEAEENRVPRQLPELGGCRDAFGRAMEAVEARLQGDAVVLLAGDDGRVGQAVFRGSSPGGPTVSLDTPNAGGVLATDGSPPSSVTFRPDDTRTLFGAALDAAPPAPARFIFPVFAAGQAALPDGAAEIIGRIVDEARDRPTFDLAIAGFGDTMGDDPLDRRIGLRRAFMVRQALLSSAGLRPARVIMEAVGPAVRAARLEQAGPDDLNGRVLVTVR